jgi:GntR family transcriptional regulator, transcriptional repressor for pyruvate dehydrogenase complex
MAKDRHRFNHALQKAEEKLLKGEWKIGDKLPTLTAFSKELDVSVSIMREVFRVLESRGIISIEQGRGTFFNGTPLAVETSQQDQSMPSISIIDLMNLVEFRSIIEPVFAEIAAKQAFGNEIREILNSAKRMEQLVKNNESTKEEDLYFHLLIAKATHNDVSIEIYEDLQKKLRAARQYTNIKAMKEKAVNYHLMIAEAIKNRDPEKAKMYMASHMESNRELAIYEFTKHREERLS